MCTFVLAVLPPEANNTTIAELMKAHGMLLRPASTREYNGVPGEVFFTTPGFCDCGTVIGSEARGNSGGVLRSDPATQIEKLRRKGWSQAKIARWQEQMQQNSAKRTQPAERELKRWQAFLPALLASNNTPWIGLFYHDYSRTNEVSVVSKQNVSLHEEALNKELLLKMQEDVLYVFN